MLLRGMLATVLVLALAACSSDDPTPQVPAAAPTASTPSPTPLTTSAAPSPEVRVTPTPLLSKLPDEVVRTTFANGLESKEVRRISRSGNYFVRAACTSAVPGATIGYLVSRGSDPDDAPPLDQASGIPCTGEEHVNSVSLTPGQVSVSLTGDNPEIERAYVVIIDREP